LEKVLVIGALGQIGSELTEALRSKYGEENIVASDLKIQKISNNGKNILEHLDCTDYEAVKKSVQKYQITTIYHLAAILSATAEKNPVQAWKVNMNGLFNVLEVAREFNCKVFVPSSIAAFGPSTPKQKTPQVTIQRPNTMYGVTKVAGELLCDYYYSKFGVDVRGVRYPGIISYKTLPGGGTTDYAVEIYYEALKQKKYECFLEGNTYLDMMYMPDAVRASIELMEADPKKLKNRNAYNISAMSINPLDIAKSIKKFIPEFELKFKIDPMKQAIADSWPQSLDDNSAREEWNWKAEFDLDTMTKDMLEKLSQKLKIEV